MAAADELIDEFICELFSVLSGIPAWAFRLSPRRSPGGPEWSTWRQPGQCGASLPSLHFALCWVARVRYVTHVIPGRLEEANPESRDSGSGPSDHPGMTGIDNFLFERGMTETDV